MTRTTAEFPCPCCGYLSFDEPPGSYSICPICFWEDDSVQLRFVLGAGGANTPSLLEAQRNYQRFGAMEPRFVGNVHPPTSVDRRDPEWRPLDPAHDELRDFLPAPNEPWPDDLTTLYYWRRGT